MLDLSIYMDIARNPGPNLSYRSGKSMNQDKHVFSRIPSNSTTKLQYSPKVLRILRWSTKSKVSTIILDTLKHLSILKYRGKRGGKRQRIPTTKCNPRNYYYQQSIPRGVNLHNLTAMPRDKTLRTVNLSTQFVPSISLANVMSLSPKIDEINYFMRNNDIDIGCFTETWLKSTVPNSAIDIRGFNLIRQDRTFAQHGGVCIYIKDSMKFTVLNRLQDPEMKAEVLWCKIDRNRLPRGFSYLIIGVVYHPPSADDNYMNNYLLNCLSFIESEFPNAAILIVRDFNRLDISQLETQFNLKQIVKFNTRGERTLDLIITNLSNFYQSPVRFPPFGLADHFTIVTKPALRPKTVTRKLFVQVRDLRVSSKVALGRYLSSIDWSVLDNLVSCQSKLDFFTNILKAGIYTIMPLKTVRIHINDAPWMTAQLKDLINCRLIKPFSSSIEIA